MPPDKKRLGPEMCLQSSTPSQYQAKNFFDVSYVKNFVALSGKILLMSMSLGKDEPMNTLRDVKPVADPESLHTSSFSINSTDSVQKRIRKTLVA